MQANMLNREEQQQQSPGLWGLTPAWRVWLLCCSVPLQESSLQAPELCYSIEGCVMNIRLRDPHSEKILKNSKILYFSMNQWIKMFVCSSDQHLSLSPLHLPSFLVSFCLSSPLLPSFFPHPCAHPTNPKSVILWGQFFIWMLLLACFFSGTE